MLLKELGQDLEHFNKIQSGVMAAKGLLSGGYSISGLLTGGVPGTGLDLLINQPLDYFTGQMTDWLNNQVFEKGVDAASEHTKNFSSKLSDYCLNHSASAKQGFIEKTLSKFDSDLSLGEVFNLTETLLLNCSMAETDSKKSQAFYGKLLVIQDPAGLDSPLCQRSCPVGDFA